jgi:hypothetical protein
MLVPWTDTPQDWARNNALRALRVLAAKADGEGVPMDGAWYRAIATETALDVLDSERLLDRHWATHDACVSRSNTHLGVVARFVDRTVLPLKAHPNHRGLLLLPERPLVLAPEAFPGHSAIDQPALSMWTGAPARFPLDPGWWEAPPSAFERWFPTTYGDATAFLERRRSAILPLLQLASQLEGFPKSATLVGGGPGLPHATWSFEQTSQPPGSALGLAIALIAQATRALFRGRMVFVQAWNIHAAADKDPRAAGGVWTFSSESEGQTSAHASLRLLAEMQACVGRLVDAYAPSNAAAA